MTDRVFNVAFDELIGVEGGYQCDPNDKGNWTGGKVGVGKLKGTKYGVSAMSYPDLDIENLTIDKAKQIFCYDWWNKCKCTYLPDSLSLMVVDFAYNSGISTAIKTLQKLLGISADGVIGPQTVGACNSKISKKLLEDYKQARLKYLCGLKTFPKYGKGWANRVNRIYNTAMKYI